MEEHSDDDVSFGTLMKPTQVLIRHEFTYSHYCISLLICRFEEALWSPNFGMKYEELLLLGSLAFVSD